MLRAFLDENEIKQAEIVTALNADKAQVSRWVNQPDANLTREKIDALLAFLSHRLNRPVTYEEAFDGRPALPAAVNES